MCLGYFILFILIFVSNGFLFCESLKQFFVTDDRIPTAQHCWCYQKDLQESSLF